MIQSNADQLHRYLFEQRNCRGELVQLHSTYARIIEGHNYPPVIAQLLGEALSATCLLTATIKFEGEITLQIQGSGPLSLLVINGRNDQTMRGIARVQSHVGSDMTFKQLIGQGQMVITIAPDKGERYQGVVELSEGTFSACLEQYFYRSEQLATSLKLFADIDSQQCGGILIQALPKQDNDDDDFSHLQVLANTLKAEELYELPAEQVLHRLFHEENVTLYPHQDVTFHCSCSRERSMNALISMGKAEVSQLFSEQEQVDIHCQYCNTHHVFSAEDFDELFGLTNKKIH